MSILLVEKLVWSSAVCFDRQLGCWSFLTNDSSMSNNSKSPPAVGSVEGAGGVVDSGNVGSEGLGLGGGPVLSLEGLGHRLVGHLAGSTVHGSSVEGGWC